MLTEKVSTLNFGQQIFSKTIDSQGVKIQN